MKRILFILMLAGFMGLNAFSHSTHIQYNEGIQPDGMTQVAIRVWYITADGVEIRQPDIIIPASSPTGGGSIDYPVIFDQIDSVNWIKVQAIVMGDEPIKPSLPSNWFIYTIDRTPPKSPQ